MARGNLDATQAQRTAGESNLEGPVGQIHGGSAPMNTASGERMLWAITAKGRLSSRSYTSLFDQLVVPGLETEEGLVPLRRRVTSWLLDALGHIETYEDEQGTFLEPG